MSGARIGELIEDLVALGELTLNFGEVERMTQHPDGRPETDTTHTVMLIWVACSLAARAGLNVGLVAQLAAVHDAPEAISGDRQTLRISPDELRLKEEAEEEGAAAIHSVFLHSSARWISDRLTSYRNQYLPEARFVRAVDKMLPKLTHLLNDARAIKGMGMDRREFFERMAVQDEEIRAYAGEFEEVLAIRTELVSRVAGLLPLPSPEAVASLSVPRDALSTATLNPPPAECSDAMSPGPAAAVSGEGRDGNG